MANYSFLQTILSSIFFKNSSAKAGRLSGNSKGIILLLGTLFTKLQAEGGSGSPFTKIINKLKSLALLVRYFANGRYRFIETKNIVIILSGLIYFISPIDLIPDFLPVIGFADDIALITFIYNSVSNELEKFDLWLLNQQNDKNITSPN